ncbi:hypothetical protein Y032_0036g3253 [Ancylostoma ceylanicum]|uniref:Uncharacterized protein n=1 Tax=Ancylostoma ceylanicum TaxID=53326 RepID=A0A016UKB4_9BILA|nr:hypothetical protein Y032_0036g3253 [Ancylostoma ceylanicum]
MIFLSSGLSRMQYSDFEIRKGLSRVHRCAVLGETIGGIRLWIQFFLQFFLLLQVFLAPCPNSLIGYHFLLRLRPKPNTRNGAGVVVLHLSASREFRYCTKFSFSAYKQLLTPTARAMHVRIRRSAKSV